MLLELLFYDELNIVKTSKAFKGYVRSYSVEVIDSKDPSIQFTISRPSIKDLFKDLLAEIKGFKYQITLKVLLNKCKKNGEREFAPVYFDYTAKNVIGFEDSLDTSSQEIFNRIDNWISERSDWVTESMEDKYVNISIYSPLLQILFTVL